MKRIELSLFVFAISILFLIGCASERVRYTYDEIKGYPQNIQELIMKGEISTGMTKQQVRYAWGAPDRTTTLEPLDGKAREEWIYTKLFGVYEEKRLLFIDDKLSYIIPEPQRPQKQEER